MKILIIGINGFIGSNLVKAILEKTDWEIHGLDISSNKIEEFLSNPRLCFKQGDMNANFDWISKQTAHCDLVLPLAAIATPATYVQDPIKVFELDFEANLKIVRLCLQHNTRLIFPSTSEIYGMSDEEEFNEETSKLVQGPICKERWIYSCSKQMMDRVIYAYGKHDDLNYTLFRPFNWIGPNQDDPHNPKPGSSRVLSQFISNIIHNQNMQLVDGGMQRRSFTYIDDGINALMKIIANKADAATNKIFNIGNPENNCSIKELAEITHKLAQQFPKYANQVSSIKIIDTSADDYYGKNYQDVKNRTPSIANAKKYLNWHPTTSLEMAIQKTLEYHLV